MSLRVALQAPRIGTKAPRSSLANLRLLRDGKLRNSLAMTDMITMPETPFNIPADKLPRHVAIIMDGNGRWALSRGPRAWLATKRDGEPAPRNPPTGVWREVPHDLCFFHRELGTSAGGSERSHVHPRGCDRPGVARVAQEGVQLRHIGRLERLAPTLQEKVLDAVDLTKNNDRLILNVAFNYGGRAEIVNAIQKIMKDGIPPEDVTDELVSRYLYTAGVRTLTIIIRTSGELRVSNFDLASCIFRMVRHAYLLAGLR